MTFGLILFFYKSLPSKIFFDIQTDVSYDNNLGLDARKPVFGGFANNTGADQPAHPRSLISAFVIRVL